MVGSDSGLRGLISPKLLNNKSTTSSHNLMEIERMSLEVLAVHHLIDIISPQYFRSLVNVVLRFIFKIIICECRFRVIFKTETGESGFQNTWMSSWIKKILV